MIARVSHRRSDPVLQFDERYFNATYTNNVKTSGGSTDARDHAGNVTDSQTANIHDTYWDFDAAGRTARWEERVSYGDNTWKAGETKYDGDGRASVVTDLTRHRVGGVWYDWDAQNSYNIYSSVTGHKITELTTTGDHAQTFVYMGGTKIARFDSHGVAFHVTDPMTGSEQQTADGSFDPESERQ